MSVKQVNPEISILRVFERRTTSLSKSAISRKTNIEENDLSPILTTLAKKGVIQVTYRRRKISKNKLLKSRVYKASNLFQDYVKDYRFFSTMIPLMERSSLANIQKIRSQEQISDLKLRQANYAINYLVNRGILSSQKIKANQAIPVTDPAFLIYREAKTVKKIPDSMKKKLIEIRHDSITVQAYPEKKNRKLAGYWVETPWKMFSFVDLKFVYFLHTLEKHLFGNNKTPVNINVFNEQLSLACGIQYPIDVLVVACFLAEQAHYRINVSCTFNQIVPEQPLAPTLIPRVIRESFGVDVPKESPYFLDIEEEKERNKKELISKRDPW